MIYINSARYSGIQSEDKSVLTQFSTMLGRVFRPHLAPLQAAAYIESTMGESGWIGQDQQFEFSKHLKDPQGKAIQPNEKDFYVHLKVIPLTIETPSSFVPWLLFKIESILKKIFSVPEPKQTSSIAFKYMPSTIFYGAKENSKIRYFLDGQLVELALQQQLHPKPVCKRQFDDFFKELSCSVEVKTKEQASPPYLFIKDKPQDEFVFPVDKPIGVPCHWAKRCLSKNAKHYTLNNGTTNVTEEIAEELASYRHNFINAISDNEESLQALLSSESLKSARRQSNRFTLLDSSISKISEEEYKLEVYLHPSRVNIDNMQILIDQNYIFICGIREPFLPDTTTSAIYVSKLIYEFYLPDNCGPINPESITLNKTDDGRIYFSANGNYSISQK